MNTLARSENPKSDPAENWLPVVGFEDRYEVSDQGRVWSRVTNRILRPAPQSRGYLSVGLYFGHAPKHCKTYLVHDLVMAAFVGEKPEGFQVDHISGDKGNNQRSNLEYVTPLVNVRRAVARGPKFQKRHSGAQHANAKLSKLQAATIRRRGLRETRAALAREFGVTPNTIRDIVLGRTYRVTN